MEGADDTEFFVRTSTKQSCTFSVVGPLTWNGPPFELRTFLELRHLRFFSPFIHA